MLAMEDWLASYRKEWLRADVIAGLTTAAVVIPKAMADATIAGLPVEVRLYTAFLPMVIYRRVTVQCFGRWTRNARTAQQ